MLVLTKFWVVTEKLLSPFCLQSAQAASTAATIPTINENDGSEKSVKGSPL